MTNIEPIWDLDGFLASAHAGRSDVPESERADEMRRILGVLDTGSNGPGRIDGADVHAWIGHILPSAYAAVPERAPVAIKMLRAYFEYLDERGVFSDGYEVRQSLENVAGEFLTAVRTGKPVHHHHGHHHHKGDDAAPARGQKSAGRNDPCPCGSGQKFKKCCGRS